MTNFFCFLKKGCEFNTYTTNDLGYIEFQPLSFTRLKVSEVQVLEVLVDRCACRTVYEILVMWTFKVLMMDETKFVYLLLFLQQNGKKCKILGKKCADIAFMF